MSHVRNPYELTPVDPIKPPEIPFLVSMICHYMVEYTFPPYHTSIILLVYLSFSLQGYLIHPLDTDLMSRTIKIPCSHGGQKVLHDLKVVTKSRLLETLLGIWLLNKDIQGTDPF